MASFHQQQTTQICLTRNQLAPNEYLIPHHLKTSSLPSYDDHLFDLVTFTRHEQLRFENSYLPFSFTLLNFISDSLPPHCLVAGHHQLIQSNQTKPNQTKLHHTTTTNSHSFSISLASGFAQPFPCLISFIYMPCHHATHTITEADT